MTREELGGASLYRGKGCDACNNTGYRGRVGLFELMMMNDAMRDMIMANASTDDLRQLARKGGMVTLRDAGIKSMLEGTTTSDEVIRETVLEA